MFSDAEIQKLSREFETSTPQQIVQWAVDMFWPQVALSSSFQTQSVPLLHMTSLIRHDIGMSSPVSVPVPCRWMTQTCAASLFKHKDVNEVLQEFKTDVSKLDE